MRKNLTKLIKPERTRIIAICNQKGGCGKTTSVINLGAALALHGLKVLLIDLDSQGNATSGVGIPINEVEVGTFELLCDPKTTQLDDIIKETKIHNLSIAPATISLSEFESRIANELGRENRLKKALKDHAKEFDIILIDTPPSLGLLSVNALNAATEVFISMQAHPFALDGLHLLLDSIQAIQEELNPSLKITGVITTMFDPRTKISREIMSSLHEIESIQGSIFSTVIRQNIKITEASKLRLPVMVYDPDSPGAQDYMNLAREMSKIHAVPPPVLEQVPQKKRSSKLVHQTIEKGA